MTIVPIDEFKAQLGRHQRVGLCMFAAAPLSNVVNKRLNIAYGDEGDNLSRALGRKDTGKVIQYWAGNYSSADIDSALKTVDIFSNIPGCVLLVTEPGVGAQAMPVLGLIEHGCVTSGEGEARSFFSFARDHLGLLALDEGEEGVAGLINHEFHIAGIILPSKRISPNFLSVPWEAIFRRIRDNPASLFEFSQNPRRFEEFIADSYVRAGYHVELTPQSGDGGIDIIAELKGHGAIKILDQTKAYSVHRPVTANDVRAAIGVLSLHPEASKAVVTTTSTFAPKVYEEFQGLTPTRLELRDGESLVSWLDSLANFGRGE